MKISRELSAEFDSTLSELIYRNSTTTESGKDLNNILNSLQEIRGIALQQAIRYRYDPTMSQVHQEYLTMLNNLLKAC